MNEYNASNMNIIQGRPNASIVRGCVLTVGTFDGVHSAHRSILDQLVALGHAKQKPSLLVTFDPHPRSVLFSDEPPVPLLTTMEEKLTRLSTTGLDYTVVYPFDRTFASQSPATYMEDFLWAAFEPSAVLVGFDHRFGRGRTGDFQMLSSFCLRHGIDVHQIDELSYKNSKISSTAIRTALRYGHLSDANAMLGYPYTLTGCVVAGQALGRTIGYPTANLVVEDTHKIVPGDGVYASYAIVDGVRHEGLLFIGQKSNASNQEQRSIEVHIKEWSGDLYGRTVQVELIEFIRGTMRFDSVSELKDQITRDESKIQATLRAYHQGGL